MKNKKYLYAVVTLSTVLTLAFAAPAMADTTTPASTQSSWKGGLGKGMMNRQGRGMMKPGVFGTVGAINGNTLTVTGKQGFGANAASATFIVDTTNAKVMKNNTVSTVSSIAIGDMIIVQGTVTGTNVVATMIRDGQFSIGMNGGPKGSQTGQTPLVNPITGNGQPVVAGTVSSVSGSTLVITNKSNVSYTVDTTSAKIVQGQNTIAIGNVTAGDFVIVQGVVTGNSIVASSVIDQKPITTTNTGGTTAQPHRGFFGSIGHFFSSIFGF